MMLGNLGWREYGELVRGVDLGVSLMATPHPSYPPLDLAASGAAVLTNRFGLKQDLSEYSPNIICADLDTTSLLQGLRVARELALDDDARRIGYQGNRLQRSWEASLRHVLTSIREAR
jgi:O-antigen biosynthesis protein